MEKDTLIGQCAASITYYARSMVNYIHIMRTTQSLNERSVSMSHIMAVV